MKNARYELNDTEMENVVGGRNAANEKGAGFKCPDCDGWINITIYEIIKGAAIVCPHCGLVLTIDKTKSNSAIDALRKVQKAQEKLNSKAG